VRIEWKDGVLSRPFLLSGKESRSGENGVNSRIFLKFTLAQARGFSIGRDPFSLKRANFHSSEQIFTQVRLSVQKKLQIFIFFF